MVSDSLPEKSRGTEGMLAGGFGRRMRRVVAAFGLTFSPRFLGTKTT